jgi:hypothetical protein
MQVGPRPSLPIELLRKLEVAFSHNNLERAQSIVEEAFKEFKPRSVDWSSNVSDLFPPRQAAVLNNAGVIALKDFFSTNREALLSQRQVGKKMLQQIVENLHDLVREHRLTLPPHCFGSGGCDLFRDL